jgi:hypothetical protein
VFQNASKEIDEVATMIKVDVELYHPATHSKDPHVGLAAHPPASLVFLFFVPLLAVVVIVPSVVRSLVLFFCLSCVPAEEPSSGFL